MARCATQLCPLKIISFEPVLLPMKRRHHSIAMTTRVSRQLKYLWLYSCSRSQRQRSLSVSSSTPSDYLQTVSHIPTLHFQPAIPQIPLPSLQDTCQRYLATQHAFLSTEDFQNTKAVVGEFEKGEGLGLHKDLMELNKKNTHTSYITDAWMDVYLTYRASVVLNSNPASFVNDDKRPEFMEQTLRATNFTVSLLRFLKTLREGKLVPDVYHKKPSITDTEEFWKSLGSLTSEEAYQYAVNSKVQPLDMSQFSRIFNASRIPRPIRDELFKDETQRHLLVLCRGHMYVFEVLDKNGSIIPGQDIRANFEYIVQRSISLQSPDHPIGYLTTENRDTWTQIRESLLTGCKDNADNLRLIDSSLFCLCLEDDGTDDTEDSIRTGLYGNAGNRWFDKTFQLIVMKDGRLQVNMEHSWGDGITMKRALGEAYHDSIQHPALKPTGLGSSSSLDSSQAVKQLEFQLNPTLCQSIEEAKNHHVQATSQLNIKCMNYNKYGFSLAKRCQLSPDALAQLALQMGYQQVAGHVPATYESCSTAMFRHGRTETIRSATGETKRCAQAFRQGSAEVVSLGEKRALIKACSDKHRQLTREATIGQGWDRHLFTLRALAATSGRPPARVFQDPAYANINTITLSTSTTGVSETSSGAAFAPVSPTGFGIYYCMMEDSAQLVMTSYPHSPASLTDFGRSVCKAFDEIYNVMMATS